MSKEKDYDHFFEECGDIVIEPRYSQYKSYLDVEYLYQVFKARLTDELKREADNEQ